MKENLPQTMKIALALTVAALLSAAPADAAKKAVKMDAEATRQMSLGLGNLERGEYSAAISALNKAVRRQGSVSTYFLLGWAHYQRGFKAGSVEGADKDDAQSAIDAYQMALSLDPKLKDLPDASRLHFSLAMCHEAVENNEAAIESYKNALRAAPNKALIPLHAARLRFKMKDSEKAMHNLEIAHKKAAKYGQVNALQAAAKKDPAFRTMLSSPMHRRALGVVADEDMMVASNDIASGEMRDALRDAPAKAAPAQDPEVLELVAQGNLEYKFRRFGAAIAAYQDAIALDQERQTLGVPQQAQIWEKIGTSYNKLGQSEMALASLRKALQVNPLNPAAHYQSALALAVSGKTSSALGALKETFNAATNPADLRRFVIMAKTDGELEAVRDLPEFRSTVGQYADRVALR
ncbi:MAG: tetratricopeptide repeat protein [Elusimicrobiota bacterium]|nr:tetratricopeptide repeat protein [Elusimicrobiota bacterium]